MYSMISLRSQMWFPEFITSTPPSRKPRARVGVTPNPAAAFSTLTITRSASSSARRRGRMANSARRPGSPDTSPIQITVTDFNDWLPLASGEEADARRSLPRVLDRPVLADHRDLDVARVLHLGLDPLGDVLGELVRVEV